VIVICAACSRWARSPLSARLSLTVPSIDPGLRHCWRGDRPRSLPLRSPTRSLGWPGR
jgi:hypothetical protein